MSRFNYTGKSPQGDTVDGTIEASNAGAAGTELLAKHITPITINPAASVSSNDVNLSDLLPEKKVSLDDLAMFCRQMKALSRAGIPIIQAIGGLAEHHPHHGFSTALKDINKRLASGSNLATAMAQHKHIFSELFIGLIHVGESTGRLDDAFEKLIHHIELERETRNRISQAIRYPIMVMVAMAIAMFIINLFVIPTFASVFSKLGADLPLPTKILMATSRFTVDYWWLMLIVIFSSLIGFTQWIKTPDGERWWDEKKIVLPILGNIYNKTFLSRFTRAFAMLFESGVPVLQALNIVAGAVGNRYIADKIMEMHRGIERGDSLSRSAAATKMFTPLILQMISVGEESGSLDVLLNDVSDFYEQEIDYELKTLADAIEPIILIFLGIMVLILALGVFLPMWNLGSAMTG